MDPLANVLYPELRGLDAGQRAEALRAARRLPYDAFELLGIAVALIVAALFLRHALDGAGIAARLLASCVVALVSIGPFVMRRTRRGLRRALGSP